MTWLDQFHGPVLIAALCVLIYVEECGVPLPFAPGDLLLVICGLTIRSGSVNPVLAIAAVYLATIAGAMTGREIFALAGNWLLERFARSRRMSRLLEPIERARHLLERGGWPAVFVGRLTPGLRIHTTEVAGLLRLPRRTFLGGLAPAAAVYAGVFIGAGALVGPTAMDLLLHTVHRVGLWVTLATVLVLWIAGTAVVVRLLGGRSRAAEQTAGRPR